MTRRPRTAAVVAVGLAVGVGLTGCASPSSTGTTRGATAPAPVVSPAAVGSEVAGVSSASESATPPDPKAARKVTKVGMTVSPTLKRVGIAYPLTVTFPVTVKRRGAVERHLAVTVDGQPIDGAWSWRTSNSATFRPKKGAWPGQIDGFWPAKSRVKLTSTLAGTVLARDGAAKRKHTVASKKTDMVVSFRVARAFVAYVDGQTDRFVVRKNGKKIKTMLTSLGKPGFATRSGIKVATDKYLTRRMTSREAGITDPHDQYDVTATYAVRITPTGEFVHGAPWARDGRFGNFNASHGCTNLTSYDAKWYYDRVIQGDPVITTGTGRPMEWNNGLGGPWNVPWKQWLKESKLK